MLGKQGIIHLGWAAAAGAAFFIGSKTGSPSAEEIAAAQAATGNVTIARSGSSGADSGTDPSTGPRSAERDGPLMKLFGSYSLDGASLAMIAEQSVRDPNPLTRRLAFAKLLEGMTGENAMDIRTQLLAAGAEGETWRDFNYAWGAIAGKNAFDFAMTSEETDLGSAFMGWAAADPTAAIAMLNQLPEELQGQRQNLELNLISGLADTDISLATQMALQFGADDARQGQRLMREIAGEALRTGGPENAAVWIDTLPDGDQKGSAMRRVAEAYVREDPEAAAAWATSFADQDYAASTIAEISGEWAETAPRETVNWLADLPSGNAKNAGFSEALGDWEDRDPSAAGEYLMAMAPSPERDAAVSGFARGYAWQDPETAIAWASDISDPRMREGSLIQAGQAYYRRDREAAVAWLESSGLSEQAQQQIIEGRGRGWRR